MELYCLFLGVLGAALAARFSVWVLVPATLASVVVVAGLSSTLVQGIIASVISASALQLGYLLGTIIFASISITGAESAPECIKAHKNGN
jgi:uncharacterized membrane protein